MAASGQFAVDPDSARKLAKPYDDMLDRIHEMRANIDRVSQGPKLGSGPYAMQVAEFTTKAAVGDDQSFEAVLDALEVICQTASKAYTQAAKNYDETDEDAKRTFDSGRNDL